MEKNNSSKTLVIVIVLAVVLAVGYLFYSKYNAEKKDAPVPTEVQKAQPVDK